MNAEITNEKMVAIVDGLIQALNTVKTADEESSNVVADIRFELTGLFLLFSFTSGLLDRDDSQQA